MMNKRSSIVLTVTFFCILGVVGTVYAVNGEFPFGEGLRKISSEAKSTLYIPAKEDHAIIAGTFDMNPQLGTPDKNGDSALTSDESSSSVSSSTPDQSSVPVSSAPEQSSQTSQSSSVGQENQNSSSSAEAAQSKPSPVPTTNQPVDLDLTNSTGYLIIGDTIMQMCNVYDENLTLYANNINRLKSRLPDTTVITMVAPNSFPFYAPKQYITPGVNQKEMIDRLYAKLNTGIIAIDAYSALESHKEEYLYFRTDHHWTAKGAYYAYTAFCKTMGFTAAPLPSKPSGVFENYIGTFYKSLEQYPQAKAAIKKPDYIEYYVPKTAHTATYYQDTSMTNGKSMQVVQPNLSAVDDKYLVFLEGLRPLIHINTQVKNGRSILIIKDSYANAFVPFLLEHYEDIYVVDFRNFNAPGLPVFDAVKFVQDHQIDEVMVTNYPYVPNDKSYCELIGKLIP